MSFSNYRICVAVTGASGSIYAERLIQELLKHQIPRIYICASETGTQVINHELSAKNSEQNPEIFSLKNLDAKRLNKEHQKIIRIFEPDNLFAPIASGSSAPTHMVVLPCSMGALARIALGISSNLIERAADVMLKQKRSLILCPRETPLSTIHLRNMLTLSKMGCHIVPTMPGFYQNPKTVDDLVDYMVGRILELLHINHELYTPWNKPMR